MNIRSSEPIKDEKNTRWSSIYFGEQETRIPSGPLAWWHARTAPALPPANASFAQREVFRRGRLASTVLLVTIAFLLAVVPIAIREHNRGLLIILIVSLITAGIVLPINRRGNVTLVGIIMVMLLIAGLFIGIIQTPGGLGTPDLVRIDLLVIPELLAVSLLSTGSVFIVAAITSLFTWVVLTFAHRTPELIHLISAPSGYGIIVRPIALQIIVAIVVFLWVRSATQAIARANRAESIATLEHTLAEQEHTIAEQKYQLDASIQQVVQTLMKVANGDYKARVPLNESNVLWQVAGAINNLLSRAQRLRQDAYELQKTREDANNLIHLVRRAKAGQPPTQLPHGGTVIDIIALEIFSASHPSSLEDKKQISKEGHSN